jgi:hypothetical protein
MINYVLRLHCKDTVWIILFTVQSDWSGHIAFIFRWLVKMNADCSSKTFLTMYQTIRCPNPHHYEHLKSSTKNIKNNWTVDGKVTSGKMNERRAVLIENSRLTRRILKFYLLQMVGNWLHVSIVHAGIVSPCHLQGKYRCYSTELACKELTSHSII